MARIVDSLARQPVDLDEFRQLMAQIAPVVRADQKRLQVLDVFETVLPGRGLVRGQSVSISADSSCGAGALSLASALIARATQIDSWCAVVGVASFGVSGAAQLGVSTDRLALVPLADASSRSQWIAVTSALVDTCDVVITRVPKSTSSSHTRQLSDGLRRLQARSRQQESILLTVGQVDQSADLRLRVISNKWVGIERGWGLLGDRMMQVEISGKGVARHNNIVQLLFRSTGDRVVVSLGGDS